MYATIGAAMPVAWLGALTLAGSYDPRRHLDGRDVWRGIAESVGFLLAIVASVAWIVGLRAPRDYVLLLVGLAGVLTLTGRLLARQVLRASGWRGECVRRVLAVGQAAAVQALVDDLRRVGQWDAVVVGCCLPAPEPDRVPPVAVLGGIADVVSAVDLIGADTIAVLPCPELQPSVVRRLAWALEGRTPHFVVVTGLVDVASTRLSVRPIGDLAVLHVRHPRLAGPGWVVKALADRVLALLARVVLAPVLVGIGVLVRLTSSGPALFRQTRVGIHGREFTFLKFRTMYVDAERRRAELSARNINGDGLLFKVRDDPRVTRVGAFLRRWSLDELPQFANILRGDMSLVGPRPPLPDEVARYTDDVRRRLAVKPGLTGLWQVNGRSDLSWEDSVRLDLYYVDNWSLTLDATILLRTVTAVLHRAGAY
jgi:exopolysaccharide biosynthesis polyprenyl glycosylphosphotransferase